MAKRDDREPFVPIKKVGGGGGGGIGGSQQMQQPRMPAMRGPSAMGGMDVVGSGGAGNLPGITNMGDVGVRDMPLSNLNVKASPWLRDNVSLSLEAQINMIEQRNISGLLPAPPVLNRLKVLCVRPGNNSQIGESGMPIFGLFVAIEPPGNYVTQYNSRKKI